MGPSIPLDSEALGSFGTLETLGPAHLICRTRARGCVMLVYPEARGRGGRTFYPLKLWSPGIFGPFESSRPKLDLRSHWNIQAESWTLWPSEPWIQGPDVLEPLELLKPLTPYAFETFNPFDPRHVQGPWPLEWITIAGFRDLDKTYHTAQQASFRSIVLRNMEAKLKCIKCVAESVL